jgi:hypothetical protein
MHSAAPDYVEPVLGWRVWLVVDQGDALRLSSVLYPTIWPVRSVFVGDCGTTRAGVLRHRVPHLRCGCGVHAAVSVEDAASYFDGRGRASLGEIYRVVGRVALWGSVIEGDKGWRASHAYPHALYVPARSLGGPSAISSPEVASGLRDYGVPVSLLDGVTKARVCGALRTDFCEAA